MEYGLRWQEFNKSDRITTKEKFFKTETAREAFIEKIREKDNFFRILSFQKKMQTV